MHRSKDNYDSLLPIEAQIQILCGKILFNMKSKIREWELEFIDQVGNIPDMKDMPDEIIDLVKRVSFLKKLCVQWGMDIGN